MISLLSVLVFCFFNEAVTVTIGDPCPNLEDISVVADMCESSSSIENSDVIGNVRVDSVVLRVRQWKDQCTCRLSLINQTKTEHVVIVKYDGLTNAAPKTSPCGLAIEIKVNGTQNNATTLNCILPSTTDAMIGLNQHLELTSIITDGQFSHGYCLQIYRATHTELPLLRIQCDYRNAISDITGMLSTLPNSYNASTYMNSDKEWDYAQTTEMIQSSVFIINSDRGLSQIFYIAIGVGSSVLLLIIVLVVIVIVRNWCRKKAQQSSNYINDTCTFVNNASTDHDCDGLKDNVLYVSGDTIVSSEEKHGPSK